MTFLELAHSRYSTKKYDPALRLNQDQLSDLKEILRFTPSSINSQPWKFIFIENDDLKAQLAEKSLHNLNKIKEASNLIVFAVEDNLSHYQQFVDNEMNEVTREYFNNSLKSWGEQGVKEWFTRQVYIALGFCLSACASMNIDSTPMEGIEIEAYKEILGLDNHKPLFAVAIGYRDSEDSNQPSIRPKSRRNLDDVVQVFA